MGYFKRVVLYIIVMVVSVFIIGCNKSSDTSEKPKELKILRIYTIKKDIEMENLKRETKGRGLLDLK
ncbi:hypothetical protein JMUB7481_27100 [Staphylococcus aureus]